MGRVAAAALAGMACVLLAMAAIGCRQEATKQNDGDNGTPGIDTSEVEAVARAYVEIAGTFDYRDQKSHYDQLQPLLADKFPFQESSYAVSTQRIPTARVTATRVVSISDDDAIVTVTAEDFRQYLPEQSSEVVEERVLQRVDCRLVLQEGQWLVSRSRGLSGEPLPQEDGETPSNGPTPSTKVSPVPTARQEDVRRTIRDFLLRYIGPDAGVKDVGVGGNTYYTDSSGTEWVGFTVFPIPPDAVDTAFGVMKKPSAENWKLLGVGTGPVADVVPDDVKKGLGIDWRR